MVVDGGIRPWSRDVFLPAREAHQGADIGVVVVLREQVECAPVYGRPDQRYL